MSVMIRSIGTFLTRIEAGGHDVEADIAQYEIDSAITAVVEVVNVSTGERFRTPRVSHKISHLRSRKKGESVGKKSALLLPYCIAPPRNEPTMPFRRSL